MADGCVSRVAVFASLSAQDQQRVEELARPTNLKAGEAAYRADDDLSQLMVLHSGRLKIFRLSADGSEQLIRVLAPGDFTGRLRCSRASAPDSAQSGITATRTTTAVRRRALASS
mgnify:CR=1 FL=1